MHELHVIPRDSSDQLKVVCTVLRLNRVYLGDNRGDGRLLFTGDGAYEVPIREVSLSKIVVCYMAYCFKGGWRVFDDVLKETDA